jgi:hypothetical protein
MPKAFPRSFAREDRGQKRNGVSGHHGRGYALDESSRDETGERGRKPANGRCQREERDAEDVHQPPSPYVGKSAERDNADGETQHVRRCDPAQRNDIAAEISSYGRQRQVHHAAIEGRHKRPEGGTANAARFDVVVKPSVGTPGMRR